MPEKAFNFIARFIFFPVVIPRVFKVRFGRNTTISFTTFDKIFDSKGRVSSVSNDCFALQIKVLKQVTSNITVVNVSGCQNNFAWSAIFIDSSMELWSFTAATCSYCSKSPFFAPDAALWAFTWVLSIDNSVKSLSELNFSKIFSKIPKSDQWAKHL